MEHRGLGSGEAFAGGNLARPPARSARPRRPAALWPGQMVPRRTAAAMGPDLLLAHRRRRDYGATARCWRAPTRLTHSARWTPSAFARRWRAGSGSMRNMPIPRSRIRCIICSASASLPINVDPVDNHLEDPIERERVRRVFERGLEHSRRIRLAAAARNRPQRTRMADWFVDAAWPASVRRCRAIPRSDCGCR